MLQLVSMIRHAEQRDILQKAKAFRCEIGIAIRCFVEYNRGGKKLKIGTPAGPPPSCKLLMCSDLKIISAQPSNKVADNAGFDVHGWFHSRSLPLIPVCGDNVGRQYARFAWR